MSTPDPGWYPDANGVVRWYDGERWTDHVQAGSVPSFPQVPPPLPPPPAGPSGLRIAGLVLLVLVVLAGIVVAVVLIGTGGGDSDDEAGDPEPAPTSATSSPETAETSEPPTETPSPTPTETPTPTPTPPPTPTAPPGPTPDQVADRFSRATIDADCRSMRLLSTPAFFATLVGCDGDRATGPPASFSYVLDPAVVRGVDATVRGSVGPGSAPGAAAPDFRFTMSLVNTSAGWRVSALAERP